MGKGIKATSSSRMTSVILLAAIFSLTLSSFSAFALGGNPPHKHVKKSTPTSMATLGDSITAGAMAKYDISSWKNPFSVAKILGKLVLAYSSKDLSELEYRELSWSTGNKSSSKVMSHGKRLSKLSGVRNNFKAYNGAMSGKISTEVLEQQIDPMIRWSQKVLRQGAPDYVAILVGANDVCSDLDKSPTSAEKFESNLNEMVAKISGANKDTHILFSEIPNISSLWDTHKGVRLTNLAGARTCQELWAQLGFCDNFLAGTPESRKEASRVLQEFNTIIQKVVSEQSAKGLNVRYAGGVYDRQAAKEDISIDCFHPSEKGQKRLAEQTWQGTIWANQ